MSVSLILHHACDALPHWKKYSAKITHRVVTLVSVNSHALQTNQVTLADDAYLTGKYHEENGQTCLPSTIPNALLQILHVTLHKGH